MENSHRLIPRKDGFLTEYELVVIFKHAHSFICFVVVVGAENTQFLHVSSVTATLQFAVITAAVEDLRLINAYGRGAKNNSYTVM